MAVSWNEKIIVKRYDDREKSPAGEEDDLASIIQVVGTFRSDEIEPILSGTGARLVAKYISRSEF